MMTARVAELQTALEKITPDRIAIGAGSASPGARGLFVGRIGYLQSNKLEFGVCSINYDGSGFSVFAFAPYVTVRPLSSLDILSITGAVGYNIRNDMERGVIVGKASLRLLEGHVNIVPAVEVISWDSGSLFGAEIGLQIGLRL